MHVAQEREEGEYSINAGNHRYARGIIDVLEIVDCLKEF